MRERESYRELILENIEYDCLIQNHRLDRDRLDELVELMVDTVCSNREMIRIAGDDYPAEVVKSRFLKLNSSHISSLSVPSRRPRSAQTRTTMILRMRRSISTRTNRNRRKKRRIRNEAGDL